MGPVGCFGSAVALLTYQIFLRSVLLSLALFRSSIKRVRSVRASTRNTRSHSDLDKHVKSAIRTENCRETWLTARTLVYASLQMRIWYRPCNKRGRGFARAWGQHGVAELVPELSLVTAPAKYAVRRGQAVRMTKFSGQILEQVAPLLSAYHEAEQYNVNPETGRGVQPVNLNHANFAVD